MSISNIFSKNNHSSVLQDGGTIADPRRLMHMPEVMSNFLSYKNKKALKRIGLVVMGIVLLLVIIQVLRIRPGSQTNNASVTGSNGQQYTIGKSYSFNARNEQGKIVDKKPIRVAVNSVELNRKILIKGQPATARDGRIFLILNIEMENPYTERYYMPVNDLIRWQDGNKLRAPDVHNNLVLVDPIATKDTRIGFLVDDNQKNFSIKVGEVNGDKQTIDLKL